MNAEVHGVLKTIHIKVRAIFVIMSVVILVSIDRTSEVGAGAVEVRGASGIPVVSVMMIGNRCS